VAYTYRLPARRFILFDLFNTVTLDSKSLEVFDQRFREHLGMDAIGVRLEAEEKGRVEREEREKGRGEASKPAVKLEKPS
jgi:hypothetical protein